MGLKVNTNLEAINVHRNLINTNDRVANSLKRISSGQRINSAKDDASGFAVANAFKAKISSMRVAYQNATEANSMLQVADGAMNKVNDILVRMKDLATQAASDQTSERGKLDTEFDSLLNEITRIAQSTTYGDEALVSGAAGATKTFSFQVGYDNDATNRITLTINAATAGALGLSSADISTTTNAQSAMDSLDTAMSSINTYMGSIGSSQNRLSYTMENLQVGIENFSASESAIRDVDMAFEMMTFTKNQILQQSGMAMLSQANMAPQQVLSLLGG